MLNADTIEEKIPVFAQQLKNRHGEMNWKNVEEEIIRNMGEELGSKSNGITHYDLLVNGVKEELGLDISNIQISESTKNFIESMTVLKVRIIFLKPLSK